MYRGINRNIKRKLYYNTGRVRTLDPIPYTRPEPHPRINKVVNQVKEKNAGVEHFRMDNDGLKRAYENPSGIFQNGSILYVAGTKSFGDALDDLKLPFYKTRDTQRYKDVKDHIERHAIEIDGKKHYGITDIIGHSLASSVNQQINEDYGNISRTRSYGSPFISFQRPSDTGTNIRVRKAGDPVSIFDGGSTTLPSMSLNPLYNHSYFDIANVRNKEGNIPITTEEFMQQFSK